MKVKPISVTMPIDPALPCKTPEELIVYTARVSSPKNQGNVETGPKLLHHCMKEGHWSVFAMVDMTFEVETSRAISAQILRHTSLAPQEFSQRYAEVQAFEVYDARRQDRKDRQNSVDDLDEETKDWFLEAQDQVQTFCSTLYEEALKKDIAKECARFLLPMSARTVLYLKGSVRSWIHYFGVRKDGKGVQKEHRDIAEALWPLFAQQFPVVAEAVLLYTQKS